MGLPSIHAGRATERAVCYGPVAKGRAAPPRCAVWMPFCWPNREAPGRNRTCRLAQDPRILSHRAGLVGDHMSACRSPLICCCERSSVTVAASRTSSPGSWPDLATPQRRDDRMDAAQSAGRGEWLRPALIQRIGPSARLAPTGTIEEDCRRTLPGCCSGALALVCPSRSRTRIYQIPGVAPLQR